MDRWVPWTGETCVFASKRDQIKRLDTPWGSYEVDHHLFLGRRNMVMLAEPFHGHEGIMQ